MKYIAVLSLMILMGCGMSSQKKEIETFAKCDFSVHKIEKFDLAGNDVPQWIEDKKFDLSHTPSLMLGWMNKNVPFEALFLCKIVNPTDSKAAIHAFDYVILLEGVEIAAGTFDRGITILPHEATEVPLEISGNMYDMLSKHQETFINFISQPEGEIRVTFKIKPTFLLANQEIKSPTYFNFEKVITRQMFLK